MKLDFTNLKAMIDQRYISVQKHPTEELFIYNYTQKAQFDRMWNNEVLRCRGLIMDKDNNIVSRPFPKFFNLSEYTNKGGQIPAEDFVVTEKMDGSLGISYFDAEGIPHLATRGSFTSEQAMKGTQMLHNKYLSLHWNPSYTYLFEIIFKENKIVVDYAGMEDIVLLAVIDTYTGEEFPYEKLLEWYQDTDLPIVKKYDGITDLAALEQRPNAEGYVIAFPSSEQRFKVKLDEYVRLHRLVTGVNARSIWDLLRHEQPFDELLEKVPDEFYRWVKDTKENLELEYAAIEGEVEYDFCQVQNMRTRKEQALWLQKNSEHSSVVFAILDKKPYQDIIWRNLRPQAERPFQEEI